MSPQKCYVENGEGRPITVTLPRLLVEELRKATKYYPEGRRHLGRFVAEAICAKLGTTIEEVMRLNAETYPNE